MVREERDLEIVFLLIFFSDDVGHAFGLPFAVFREPFLYNGSDACGKEFDVIVEIVFVWKVVSPEVVWLIGQESRFEIETEFEIELVEDLVFFDGSEELVEIHAVG